MGDIVNLNARETEDALGRLLELDEEDLSGMDAAALRSLLLEIESAYSLHGEAPNDDPESEEFLAWEEQLEHLDDLTDAARDLLEERGR